MILRPNYLDKIKPFINVKIVKILTGIRRSGKSTILEMLKQELINRGIEEKNIIMKKYTSVDYSNPFSASNMYEEIKSSMCNNNKYYLLLDELQEIGVQIVAVAHQLLQRNALGIEKGNVALALDHLLQLFGSHTLQLGCSHQDLFNSSILISEDAVKAADDCHRDNDVAILFGGVRATGFVSNALDQIDFAVNISGQCYVVHTGTSLSFSNRASSLMFL